MPLNNKKKIAPIDSKITTTRFIDRSLADLQYNIIYFLDRLYTGGRKLAEDGGEGGEPFTVEISRGVRVHYMYV